MSSTNKKFKKQKCGGSRHGDYRAPIFIVRFVTFAAKPRSFEQKVNKKMYRAAISVILSELNRQSRLTIVDSIDVEDAKTKNLVAKLDQMNVGRPLIVTENGSENLFLAARNIPYVQIRDVQGMDPAALVGARHVVMTAEAVKKIEEWLS